MLLSTNNIITTNEIVQNKGMCKCFVYFSSQFYNIKVLPIGICKQYFLNTNMGKKLLTFENLLCKVFK